MIAQPAPTDTRHYAAQYELLRAEVLAVDCAAVRPDVARPRLVDLAIMLREGMPGWLKAVEAVIRTSSTPRTDDAVQLLVTESARAECGSAPTWLFGVPRHDLAALMASLVLSTRRAECSSPTKQGVPCH